VRLIEQIAEIVNVMDSVASHDQIEGVAREFEIVTIDNSTVKNDPVRRVSLERDTTEVITLDLAESHGIDDLK
jgi:hypothetical protein